MEKPSEEIVWLQGEKAENNQSQYSILIQALVANQLRTVHVQEQLSVLNRIQHITHFAPLTLQCSVSVALRHPSYLQDILKVKVKCG